MPGECYFDDLSMYLTTPDNTEPIPIKPIPNYEIVRNDYGQITDIIKREVVTTKLLENITNMMRTHIIKPQLKKPAK